MVRPSFCVLPGGAHRNTGGLGEGNKGANLAEVPVKDGSDVALCAFELLVIRDKKKHLLKLFSLKIIFCVFSQLCFSAVWGLVLIL